MENTQWLVFLTVFNIFCFAQVPPGCEVTTTTGYRYSQFHHLHSNPDGTMELRLRVMAKSDAHIALTTSPLVLNPLYEIVIGASGNNYTDLRRTMTGRSVSAVKTPSLLSDSEFRGFWIVVRQGEIEVGREGETLPYFHWKDPDPLPVHYYSLSSWTSTVAKWIQKCNFEGPTSWLSPTDNLTGNSDIALVPTSETYFSAEEKLKSNLLQSYNKDIRPSSYHNVPVSVSLGLILTHFDLMEIMSTIEIHGLFRMVWRDERLRWVETDYENVTVLRFPTHVVWQPDLKLFNSAKAAEMIHFAESTLLVYPDGSVLSVPPVTFESLCRLDLRMWPWDTQTCTLNIGSWGYDGVGIELLLTGNSTEGSGLDTQDLFTTNLQWELVSTAALINVTYDECCPDNPFPIAQFKFVIRRRSPLYRATITIPALMLSILMMVAFILPPNSTEKILIGLFDLLVLTMFLFYFHGILPPLGDHTPAIVLFFSYSLVLVVISLILTVLSMTMVRMPKLYGPPYWLKNIFIGMPGRILGLSHVIALVKKNAGNNCGSQQQQRMEDYTLHVDGEPDSNLVNTPDWHKIVRINGSITSMSTIELEWFLLAYALERLVLVSYFIVVTIMMTACF